MMEDDKKLSAERSLEIIGDAIWRSRRDVTADAAMPMIVWGALIALRALPFRGRGEPRATRSGTCFGWRWAALDGLTI